MADSNDTIDTLFVTDDIIPTLKAKAAADSGGNPDLLIATIGELDPVRDFVLRMPSVNEYTAYYDAACDINNADANAQAAILWCIWPSRTKLTAARKAMYLLPNRLCEYVERAVGGNKPEFIRLDANTDVSTLEEHGIPEDVVKGLLTTYKALNALRIGRVTVSPEGAEETETFSFVLRPLGPSTTQLVRGFHTKAKYNAIKTALNHAMAWPTGPEKEALLAKYPGLPSPYMYQNMMEQGGSDAKISAKKA